MFSNELHDLLHDLLHDYAKSLEERCTIPFLRGSRKDEFLSTQKH